MDLLKSISHPDEIKALLKYKLNGTAATIAKVNYNEMSKNSRACYDMLNKTSRSFAAVIQALDGELRHPVCIFYLVLRALDTVEDDMTIPMETKVPLLKRFHTFLNDEDWCYRYSEEKDKEVLEKFPMISSEFRSLKPVYREVISDICKRMGEGMTVYLDKAPNTMQDWNEYCHCVAGLVGIGLSRLFSASGLEDPLVGEDPALSNSMGLFLQKTNIIRDYLEDVLEDREFWPKEAWGKYGAKQKDLYAPEKRKEALACLNELVTNALQHIPDCIKYMSRLKNQSVFNFCAIPQVMAIATLERCYDNYDVFKRVVKIRKGETVKMMMEATNVNSVKAIMSHFVQKINLRIPPDDPSAHLTRQATEQALKNCNTDSQFVSSSQFYPIYVSCAMLSSAILWAYWTGISHYIEDIFL